MQSFRHVGKGLCCCCSFLHRTRKRGRHSERAALLTSLMSSGVIYTSSTHIPAHR